MNSLVTGERILILVMSFILVTSNDLSKWFLAD